MRQGPGLPLALTSCPLHTCRADSPFMPSLEMVPSSPEPRNLSLCLVKGTLGLLWTMCPGQLNKGEGASYRESAADPLLGTHLSTSHGQSILTIQGLWCRVHHHHSRPPEARPSHNANSFLKQNPKVLAGLPHPPRLGGCRVSQWEPCFLISLVLKN